LKAPFVWFGGKRRVADAVWRALGDVDNYVEPFAGSLACLLERPKSHNRRVETCNDADAYLCNVWRAIQAAPHEVARHCDWPVNETDLFARHLWLVNEGVARIAALERDPDYYDPKVAGWWLWGINAWIGSGWCSGDGPWKRDADGAGVNRKLPHLGDGGRGVHRQLPHLGNQGQGVNQPDAPDAFTAGGSGAPRNEWHNPLPDLPAVYGYMQALSNRLRRVRVCYGDWSRVVTDGALDCGGTVGVFLDPPYLGDVRTRDLYRVDDHSIAHDVRQWCLDHGDDPRLRIVLAGYTDEHETHMPDTWRRHRYSASVAYQTAENKGGSNAENRHKECLWLSPACATTQRQIRLAI